MAKNLFGAALVAAIVSIAIPAHAAKTSAGCSSLNIQELPETIIENMADGDGKMTAQKEVALAQELHAQRQDGRLRHAPEQGDELDHGEVRSC